MAKKRKLDTNESSSPSAKSQKLVPTNKPSPAGYTVDAFDMASPIDIKTVKCSLCKYGHDFGRLLKKACVQAQGLDATEEAEDEMDDEVDEAARDILDAENVWISKFALKCGLSKNANVHYYCAVASPQVWFDQSRWKNVAKEVFRSRSLKCSDCGLTGATVGCMETACSAVYHLPCVLANGTNWLQITANRFLCSKHTKKVIVPEHGSYDPLLDISKGFDALPVTVQNTLPHDTLSPLEQFCYINKNVDSDDVTSNFHDVQSIDCCQCEERCDDVMKCACLRNGRNYTDYGKLIPDSFHPILECNFSCSCSYRRCSNRVVANGLRYRLQVFRKITSETMSKLEKDVYPKPWWGVKTLDNIPKNAFVCEIVGQLVRKKKNVPMMLSSGSANVTANSEETNTAPDTTTTIPFDTWEKKNRQNTISFSSFEFIPLVPSTSTTGAESATSTPPPPNITTDEICVDCSIYGNVGAFIQRAKMNNNSAPSNLLQRLIYTDKRKIPRLALFAAVDIPMNSELILPIM